MAASRSCTGGAALEGQVNRLECMVLVGLQVGWEEVALCVPARCKDLAHVASAPKSHGARLPVSSAACGSLGVKGPGTTRNVASTCSRSMLFRRLWTSSAFCPLLQQDAGPPGLSGFFLLSAPAASS